MNQKIRIEVAYALPHQQIIKIVEADEGITVEQAIERSGLLREFQEIDLKINRVGVFGHLCKLDKVLRDYSRVEIYRHLTADPKVTRLKRARLK